MRVYILAAVLTVAHSIPFEASLVTDVSHAATPPCCQGACKTAGEEKYWSIASGILGTKHCGECCMKPSDYKLYHFFEKNLTHSDVASPCASFGYTKYDSTVTHGFGPVKMTLDLYDLNASSAATAVADSIAVTDASPDVILATFDGADKKTTFTWSVKNDPVMGGGSTSTSKIDNGTLVFDGSCRKVKYLNAPGFASVRTGRDGTPGQDTFNSAAACVNGTFDLMVRSNTSAYKGFKVGWSAPGIAIKPKYGKGPGSFKAGFQLKQQSDWQLVRIPMRDFSDDWSPFTGRCDTKDPFFGKQHHCCGAGDDAQYCPTTTFLSSITDLEVWAEGVEGDFHIELKWIGASKAAPIHPEP